jgi:hypothetical protein
VSEEKDPKGATETVANPGDDAARAALAGDAAATDSDAGPEAGEKRIDWRARYLTEVTPALEEKNRLKAERDALEDELRAAKKPPTADPQAAKDVDEVRELQQLVTQASIQAENGDATSKLALKLLEDRLREKQETMEARRNESVDRLNRDYLAEATVIGDDGDERSLTREERRELRAFYERNKQHFQSMEAAHDALLGRKFRETRASLIKEQKRAEKDVERDAVISTTKRDVGAGEVRARKMTEAAFRSELKRLRDAEDDGAAYALQRDRIAGKIVVQG